MTRFQQSLLCVASVMASLVAVSGPALAAPPYLIANDDDSFPSTGVSFFAVHPNGRLTRAGQVATVGTGIGGGYFGANRIVVFNSANQACVFASEAGSGDIVGIAINTLTVGGSATGYETDAGTGNGIGLAMNDQYLYAGFTDSNTIGTFQVQSGCSLIVYQQTSRWSVSRAASSTDWRLRGNVLIATYTDGTIESFDTTWAPVSRGDKQLSIAKPCARRVRRFRTRSTSQAMDTSRSSATPRLGRRWKFRTFPPASSLRPRCHPSTPASVRAMSC